MMPSISQSAGAVRRVDEPTQDEERQAEEEDVEHRLLNQRVEEDRRRVDRESKSGDESRAPREQTSAARLSVTQESAPTIA